MTNKGFIMTSYAPYEVFKMPTLEARLNNILFTRKHPWSISLGMHKGLLFPLFMTFSGAYACAVSLKVDSATWYIGFQDDEWLYTHSSFDAVENKKLIVLPSELKQALLEISIEPYIKYISNLLETNVSIIESYVDLQEAEKDFLPNNFAESYSRFSFKYVMPVTNKNTKHASENNAKDNVEDGNSDDFDKPYQLDEAYTLFADVFIPQNINTDTLFQKTNDLPMHKKSSWSKESVDALPIELSFEAGYLVLSQKEIKQLEVGDILLPEEYYSQNFEAQNTDDIKTTRLKLFIGSVNFIGNSLESSILQNSDLYSNRQVFAFCSLEGNKAVVLEDISKANMQEIIQRNTEENAMSQENNLSTAEFSAVNTTSEEKAEAEISTKARTENEKDDMENLTTQSITQSTNLEQFTNELETVISFELERRVINIGDMQSITKGYTFALGSDKDSPVTLRVNGKDMGRGKLVDMDGMLGVQITKLNG